MDKKSYIQILNKPELISEEVSLELKKVCEKYPYFQSAQALNLKVLRNKNSFKYNNALKKTAAYTINRSVLFDFITSDFFKEQTIFKEEKNSITELLLPKKKTEKIKEELAIGQPLSFTENESFSFNQWMQLSSKKIISRDKTNKKGILISEKNSEKDAIINRFIETSPKIPRPNKAKPVEIKVIESKQNNMLATETLAKVYLEQKKFESAIKAYKILSLKYPEKSGFFADQIKRIQILQKNK